MTTRFLRPRVSVDIVGQAIVVPSGGEIRVDALGIPYGSGDVEIPRTEDLELADMDPRHDVRVVVTGADDVAGTSRAFNMGIRSREIVNNGRSVLLALATDEALLQDYATLTTDSGAIAQQSSLRGIVNYVLGKIGAALQPGGPDVDMRAYYAARNMFTDPRYAQTPGGGYVPGNASLWADTLWLQPGVRTYRGQDISAVHVGNPTGADSFVGMSNVPGGLPYGIQTGKTYTFSATGSVRTLCGGTTDTGRARKLNIFVKNSAGTYLPYASAQIPNVVEAGAFDPANEHRVSVTFPVPAGATEVQIRAYLGHSVGGISWTAFRLDEVHAPIDDVEFFSGNTADTTTYNYSWSGAVDGSASDRAALVNRPPEMLVWQPGITAWAFLEPLTSAAGFRLYCDELRRWYLIDPATHTIPGIVTLSGINITEGADTISRDDSEVFATGVVVIYTWKDSATGAEKTAYDTAGTPSKVLVVEYSRPFPGPGAAAAILARRSGTGRTQDVDALIQWSTTPGMEASISLVGAERTAGKISSVRFSLGDDALMSVGTRGLIDIHPGTIDALVGTIDALVGSIDSLT